MDTASTAPFHTLTRSEGDLIEAVLEAIDAPNSTDAWQGVIGLDPSRRIDLVMHQMRRAEQMYRWTMQR